jgi:hypothetical protein
MLYFTPAKPLPGRMVPIINVIIPRLRSAIPIDSMLRTGELVNYFLAKSRLKIKKQPQECCGWCKKGRN